jgi:glyoxylase-like metal-dependent hydrolase (beta-lactamase superfamily II)
MTQALPEQPEDWTEPGAFPVLPGIHRIPLPLPSDGLRAVNVYAIQDAAGLVLVDSGWASPDSERALAAGLGRLGFALADVTRVLVTHAHHDHYTQAIALRERFGSRVHLGRGERPSVEAFSRRDEPAQLALLRRCGAPDVAEAFAVLMKERGQAYDAPWGDPDVWLDDGQVITLGMGRLGVFATPGHTRGHVVLRAGTAGVLFAGDHVLPHITPSIGYEAAPEPAPLRSYLASLRLMAGLPDTLLLPAHGPVSVSVQTRVDQLLAHHEERLDAVLTQVLAGASTAYAVAERLPWTRRRHRLEDMATEHKALAILEIGAHLDLLAATGQLVFHEEDGVRSYAPVS